MTDIPPPTPRSGQPTTGSAPAPLWPDATGQAATPPGRPLAPSSGVPRWIGLLLLLPMVAGWVYWLVVPSIRTVLDGITGGPSMIGSGGRGLGTANTFAGTGAALGRSLLVALIPVLVMAIVVPLLAWAASEGGTTLRMALRLILTVPVAGFAPAIVVAAWVYATAGSSSLSAFGPEGDAPLASMTVISGLAGLGLVCGIGVAVLLAALRRRQQDRPGHTVRGALVAWGVAVLGTLAVAIQSDTVILVMTGGGPGTRTMTLTALQYRDLIRYFSSGASAGTVLLVVVAAIGLAAGLLLVLSRAHVEMDPRRWSSGLLPTSARTAGVVLGVVAVLVALVVVAIDLLPRLGLLTGTPYPYPTDSSRVTHQMLYSLLPALLTILVQVPLAYLAGLGIGAFRPLGRHSEWLLVPFGPWLFVTVTPLMTVALLGTREHHHIGSLLGLTSPIMVSVPAMFLFALFGAGHERRWRAARQAGAPAGRAFVRTVLLPSLPLVGLVAVVGFLVQAHGLLWPLLANGHTGPALLIQMVYRHPNGAPPVGLLLQAAPFGLIALVALVLLQIFSLDRLAFRTGHVDDTASPATPDGPAVPVPGDMPAPGASATGRGPTLVAASPGDPGEDSSRPGVGGPPPSDPPLTGLPSSPR